MSTKIDIINSSYDQLRISGITVNPTGGHVNSALDMLEDVMSDLETNRGININYNFEENPDANSETGLLRGHLNAIKKFLAINMAPSFNKVIPLELTKLAAVAMSGLVSFVASRDIKQVQPSGRMPVGSGYRYRNRYRRFERPLDAPPNKASTERLIIGEINDYTESYIAYLSGEIIASYLIESSTGINLISDSNTDNTVSYRAQGLETGPRGTHQSVVITITTDTGRIHIRSVEFEVKPEDHEAP